MLIAFQQKIGVPCIDQLMVRDKKNPLFINTELTTYPLYHTGFDTFKLVSSFMDSQFKALSTITLVIAELTRQLSDSLILPFNVNEYAKQLQIQLDTFRILYTKDFPVEDLQPLEMAISNFTKAASGFTKRIETLDISK